MVETKEYIVDNIVWDTMYEREISEVYRLLKDQERKIFDLAWFEDNQDGIMGYVEDKVKDGGVFVIRDNDIIAGMFILDNPRTYKDYVIACDVHCAISKKYWGKDSRDVCNAFKEYLKANHNIKRLIANVPQCGYGVIKLLKNIGFKHEGTIKKVLVFKDKNNNDKLYDGLVYGLDLEE